MKHRWTSLNSADIEFVRLKFYLDTERLRSIISVNLYEQERQNYLQM